MYLITATYHGPDPARYVIGDGNTEAVGFSKSVVKAYEIAADAIAFDYDDNWTVEVEYNPLVESATESYKV
jgi:hypothetical protein|tara:strand:- start:529 stop:741 length:213 start_codon:yes stop_codon:yes gene_type:complete